MSDFASSTDIMAFGSNQTKCRTMKKAGTTLPFQFVKSEFV
jgi:hypothetical protein